MGAVKEIPPVYRVDWGVGTQLGGLVFLGRGRRLVRQMGLWLETDLGRGELRG